MATIKVTILTEYFVIRKNIKEVIFNYIDVRNYHMHLARSEEAYTDLCQLYPKSNIHWVEKDKTKKLLLQQS